MIINLLDYHLNDLQYEINLHAFEKIIFRRNYWNYGINVCTKIYMLMKLNLTVFTIKFMIHCSDDNVSLSNVREIQNSHMVL